MINTIFYFPSSLTFNEYNNMLMGNEISGRTIVFAAEQKAIYKGGKQYGIADISDLKGQLEELLEDTTIVEKLLDIIHNYYTTELIDNSQVIEKIERLVEQYYINNPLDLPKASKNGFGVVKIGTGIEVANGIISVSVTKGDKGDKGDPGEQGPTGPTGPQGPTGPSYDDSALRALVQGNINDLQSLISSFDQRVNSLVSEAIANAGVIQGSIPESTIESYTRQYVDGILQGYGFWTTDTQGNTITKFSEIEQRLQSIGARVTYIELHPSTGNGSSSQSGGTTLTAEQLQAIQDVAGLKTAVNTLTTNYSQFSTNEDNELVVLRWLASALDLYSNSNATWAQLAAAANDTSTGLSAISALSTRVDTLRSDLDTLETQGLEASANLSTLVQSAIDDAIATSGFVSTSALNTALGDYATTAAMYAYAGPIDTKATNALAGLEACVKKTNGKVESGVNIWADQIALSSGHKLTISSSNEISIATATLNAILDNATIKANKINWNVSGYNIDADKINLSSSHKLSISSANDLDISSATLNAIISNANISASDIDFSSGTFTINADHVAIGANNFDGTALSYGNYKLSNYLTVSPLSYLNAGLDPSDIESYIVGMITLFTDEVYITAETTIDNNLWVNGIWPTYSHPSHLIMRNGLNTNITWESDRHYFDGSGNLILAAHDTPTTIGPASVLTHNLSVTNCLETNGITPTGGNITAEGNITADGDVIAEGNMSADNLTIRNNGAITVGNSGYVAAPVIKGNSIRIGNISQNGQYGEITYSTANSEILTTENVKINADLEADNATIGGNLWVDGDLVCSSFRVGATDYGTTGTLVIGGATITIKEGIITNVSGTGWTAGV